MWDLVVFAVIGLLTGAAARVWYPGREPTGVMGTMLVGMAGSLVGGLLSWAIWPAVEGQLHSAALLMSLVAAALALVAGAIVAYGRKISVR